MKLLFILALSLFSTSILIANEVPYDPIPNVSDRHVFTLEVMEDLPDGLQQSVVKCAFDVDEANAYNFLSKEIYNGNVSALMLLKIENCVAKKVFN